MRRERFCPGHPDWKGCGEISKAVWRNIVNNSNGSKERNKKRTKEFTITIEYIWDLFLQQDRKCALSKEVLYFPKYSKDKYNASLDRIDSLVGYIPGNVQWLHKDVNMMKNKFPQERFIELCHQISLNFKVST